MKVCAVILLLFASAASAMTTSDYIRELESIRASVAANDLAAARSRAQRLNRAPVDDFRVDESLVHDVLDANVKPTMLVDRLTSTIDALRGGATQTINAADPKLLERLRAQEAARDLERGGEVLSVPQYDKPFFDRVAEAIGKALAWIWQKIVDFFDWLADFFPSARRAKQTGGSATLPWLVIAVVTAIAIILTVLALEVVRRGRKREAEPAAQSNDLASRRDEDPLSRGANEWELYAAKLAAAGKIREAIRAWYHAVLVTLYAAGILHFRKGRTNWEYVSALSPDHGWRADFVQLTRRFEVEWYGHVESADDALDECSAQAREILERVRRRRGAA
ncbi:MAG TPA: DUF4129 domain-containing protein [Thermoanaerobaculia bacterium]|nr:DUF4129 domain-containing protein [Thermoanaerobaculia bacterium]